MPTPAETTAGRRLALVVATGTYADPALAKLRAPGQDASDLAAVLDDEAIGGFEVETVLDARADSLRRRIAHFCAGGGPRDLVLVYLSCHGVLDDRGRLYYATTDTDRELLSATALPASWLNEQLEDCRCRQQILVLDCCHSGAFAKGAKGEGGLALRERFEGRGRVVLTGSRATEYSFEHGEVVGESASSVFTSALVQGLRSGDADRDRDGAVTVTELYDYAYDVVRGHDARQTPMRWAYGTEGDLLIAHSPRGAIVEPEPLPEDLVGLLESARPRVREGAVAELADLLTGTDPGRALTARAQLERVAAEDVPRVAAAARAALEVNPPTELQPTRPATTIPPPPPPTPTRSPTDPRDPRRPGRPRGPRDPDDRRRRLIAIGAAAAGLALVVAIAIALTGGGDPEAPAVGPGGIALSGQPRGVAVGVGAVWVARHDDGEVTRIDPAAGNESIDVGDGADKIAAGSGSVWVTVADGRQLVRIDPMTREVTSSVSVDVRPPSDCACPSPSLRIAQGRLWVASPRAGTITMRDLRTGKEILRTYKPGRGFSGYFAVGAGAVWAIGTEDGEPPRPWGERIDIRSGEVQRTYAGPKSRLSGIVYGAGKLWVADQDDSENTINALDPSTGESTDIGIETGVSGDDIVVFEDAVLAWEPDAGVLTRIDAKALKVVGSKTVRGYHRKERVNRIWSDLDVAIGSAWVTDPAGDAVYKVEY